MKYQKAFNIWALSDSEVKKIQPGQWIYAGDASTKGIFLGVKKSGAIVCAWHNNAVASKDYLKYIRVVRDYSLSK